jgi:hypothetical protein
MCIFGSVTSFPQYEYFSSQSIGPPQPVLCRHAKMVFGVKMLQKHRLLNTWYFQKILSVTNCAWIGWVNLSSFYANRCRTDWDIYNSPKMFQNRKILVAPSVPTLAVNSSNRPSDVSDGVRNLKFAMKFKTPFNQNPYFSFSPPLNVIPNLNYRYASRTAWYLEFCHSFKDDLSLMFCIAFHGARKVSPYLTFCGHLFAFW